jgi:hypothetical protein
VGEAPAGFKRLRGARAKSASGRGLRPRPARSQARRVPAGMRRGKFARLRASSKAETMPSEGAFCNAGGRYGGRFRQLPKLAGYFPKFGKLHHCNIRTFPL